MFACTTTSIFPLILVSSPLSSRRQREGCRSIAGNDDVDDDIGLDGGDENGCGGDREIPVQRRGDTLSLMGVCVGALITVASLAPVYDGGDGSWARRRRQRGGRLPDGRLGDDPREDWRQRRGGELPAQQRGEDFFPEGGGPHGGHCRTLWVRGVIVMGRS